MATKQPVDKSKFILPDLGEGVHEAELIRWKVQPGQSVDEHQTIAEMETDKALVEVPSPWPGVVKQLHGKAGDIISVGSVLVTYATRTGQTGADRDVVESAVASATQEESVSTGGADAGTVVGSVSAKLTVPASFRDRPVQDQSASAPGKVLATPAVRRVARESGIDINMVRGTGRGGRVTAGDVNAFTGRPAAGSVVPSEPEREHAQPVVSPDGIVQRIAFRGIRRKIAQSLARSLKTAVHFTVTDEADVTVLDQKRDEYAAVLGRKLSFLPLIMTAVCKALREHPLVNAIVDDENQEILVKGVINLGCAVDTEQGLMVPVIADADTLSVAEFIDAVADVAERCRNRTIGREQLVGGTFTISNAGSFGGLFTTPIINYPEVAILGVGRARERVLVRDGMFYAGKIMPLSLSCDHRVVDGALGARFLNTVIQLLEQPDALVRGRA